MPYFNKEQISKIPQGAINTIKKIEAAGYEAYLVGGCVRDLFLDAKPHDFDICTNAKPNEIIALLKKDNIKILTIGEKHGTITAVCEDGDYEITTYRSEKDYTDGRHPDTVIFETDIIKDLSRRDFTINAIAYNPIHNIIVDPFDGELDINNKIIKCVGNPDKRFQEDGLRILRALRFVLKYDFGFETNTGLSLLCNDNMLTQLSKERITDEIRKILTSNKKIQKTFYFYSNIISTIIPEITPCIGFEQHNKWHNHDVYNHILHVVDNCQTTDFVIKMAALLHDIGKPNSYIEDELGYGHFYGHAEVSYEISEKVLHNDFSLSNNEIEEILTLVKYHDITINDTEKSVKRRLNLLGESTFRKLLILRAADRQDHNQLCSAQQICDLSKVEKIIDKVIEENECFTLKALAINGTDIMNEFNLKPGPEIGVILNNLLENVLSDDIPNTPVALRNEVQNYLNNEKEQDYTNTER